MTTTTNLVHEFHEKFGAPISTGPASLDFERLHMRVALIGEEFAELLEAVYGPVAGLLIRQVMQDLPERHDEGVRDVVGTADALADLDYVISGMALEAGIPLDEVIREVHRSNMSKLGADGQPILREDGKVTKGPNYEPPQIARVLADCA